MGRTAIGGSGPDPATAIGTTSDPESAAGDGSVIALLKRHRTLLAAILVLLGGGLPVALLSGALSTTTAKATAAAPVYTEGTDVKLSTDLTGALRTSGGGGGGGNPTAGRLDSIRYLQKLDTLNLLRAGRLDSLRYYQFGDSLRYQRKLDTLNRILNVNTVSSVTSVTTLTNLSNLLAGRLDSVRYIQKTDTLGRILAGRLDSLRRVQKVDSLALILAGRLDSLRRVQKIDSLSLILAGRLDSIRRVAKIDTVAADFVNPATLAGVAVPAANTGATLTIPAAGAGLFHYITAILIQRVATAALAGTAILTVTTTNLPGALQWRFGNLMAAGGTQTDLNMAFTQPIKSSVANTATTIVVPVPGAAVSWTVVVHYYTGP
jgi:hypothetical protein